MRKSANRQIGSSAVRQFGGFAFPSRFLAYWQDVVKMAAPLLPHPQDYRVQ
jgi:hypothetical protein